MIIHHKVTSCGSVSSKNKIFSFPHMHPENSAIFRKYELVGSRWQWGAHQIRVSKLLAYSQLWILWPMADCKFLKCRTIFRYFYRENNNCINDRIILIYKCILAEIHTISIQLKSQLVTMLIFVKHQHRIGFFWLFKMCMSKACAKCQTLQSFNLRNCYKR